ncbi:MAG TPA: hypothetical protein VJ608_05075 [Albitalea sp.]|nr:hypothetical protein [Albitalea sp.]
MLNLCTHDAAIDRVDLDRELDQQLIALDPRARVIGRPQPDQLRA